MSLIILTKYRRTQIARYLKILAECYIVFVEREITIMQDIAVLLSFHPELAESNELYYEFDYLFSGLLKYAYRLPTATPPCLRTLSSSRILAIKYHKMPSLQLLSYNFKMTNILNWSLIPGSSESTVMRQTAVSEALFSAAGWAYLTPEYQSY